MDAPAASDVWSALGGELKPSLGLRVKAPLAGISRVTAPPVTEGLVVRSVPQAEPDETENARRLRYVELSEPGPEGFGGSRERPKAPARRRRGERQP